MTASTRTSTVGNVDVDADVQRLREDLPTLEAVERRRSQLWGVASLLLFASSGVVFLLLAAPEASDAVPDSLGLRLGFAGVSVAFLLYVFDQERRLRHLSEALVRERVLSTALTSRVQDLGTLNRVGQVVNAVLSMHEVLEVVLEAAFELTGASYGSVMVVEDDELVVAVTAGHHPAPIGTRQSINEGVAGWVATQRESLLINGQLHSGQLPDLVTRSRDDGSSVCAPMLAADELVGVLALERPHEAEAFSEWDMRAVTLFATHAATAVSNSRRYERERQNVERLARMVEARDESVAAMVHDLKTPLTAIMGFTQLLGDPDGLTASTRRDHLARIERAAVQLVEMIDGILDTASGEAGHDVRRDPVEVRQLVEDLVDLTGRMAERREEHTRPITLHCEEDEVLLRVDPTALRSIVVNLLENAVKYSPPGSPIDVTIDRSPTEVQIHVRDRGEGIPGGEIETIFERFRQRQTDPATEPSTGVGLGLYIVQSLVHAHGGRIDVDSREGEGSTFSVVFPARLVRSAPGRAHSTT